METDTATRRESKKRVIRFKGICADAAVLGVNRVSLFRALTGRPGWNLPGLVARYRALKSVAPSSSVDNPSSAHLSREPQSIQAA